MKNEMSESLCENGKHVLMKCLEMSFSSPAVDAGCTVLRVLQRAQLDLLFEVKLSFLNLITWPILSSMFPQYV